jgi:hypothetical protein
MPSSSVVIGILVSFSGMVLPVDGNAKVHVWGTYEITLTSSSPYSDPLRDVMVRIQLRGPEGRRVTVPAFWDGGSTWKARVCPELPGQWEWKSEATDQQNEGLHGRTGRFECVPYGGDNPLFQHGRLRVAPSGTFLQHVDDTPFFWLADTAWNGALRGSEDGWRQYLEDRRKKRFTAVQFVTTQWRAAVGDRDGRVAFDGRERIRIFPEFFQRMDRMIDAINAAGLVAAPVMLWAIEDRTGRNPGAILPESETLLLARYIYSRYQAHHVVWILGGDGDYRGPRAERWKRLGRSVFEDTQRSVVTMHPMGLQWVGEEFRLEPWFDFIGYQSGHGDGEGDLRWLVFGPPAQFWSRQPLRPVINLEPNYEAHLAYQSRKPITAAMVRRAAYWSLLVSPTAGVTYGAHGVWYFSDKAEEPLDHAGTGVAQPYFEAIHLEGAHHMTHLVEIFSQIPWWQLRPAPDLLAYQPGTQQVQHFVAAGLTTDRKLAVIYTPITQRLRLRTQQLTGEGEALWFNPRNGRLEVKMAFRGAAEESFTPPGEGDWVLVLRSSSR